jgi:hypothetical protein
MYLIRNEIYKRNNRIMKFKHTWGSKFKQWDKIQINIRIGAVTVFYLDLDWSARRFSLSLMNFKISNR